MASIPELFRLWYSYIYCKLILEKKIIKYKVIKQLGRRISLKSSGTVTYYRS